MAKRGLLEAVTPAAGDACRVHDFAALNKVYSERERIEGQIVSAGQYGRARVAFLGRMAEMVIEPDWQALWAAGQVEYREITPEPAFGQAVAPGRGDDGQWWYIELPLLGLVEAAQAFKAQTFDKHWLVCLRAGEWQPGRDGKPGRHLAPDGARGLFGDSAPLPERKRAWVRWEVGGGQWVQVGHPQIVAMLEQHRPR